MTDCRINWHSAIVSALKIELADYQDILSYQSEIVLNTGQRRGDLLITKAENSRSIASPIGRIFQKYNLIEYKGPGDSLGIQNYYKSLSYIYSFPTHFQSDKILEDTSLTLISHSFPQKLWNHLKRKNLHPAHKSSQNPLEKMLPGLYHINTEMIPVQLIITSQLTGEEYLWLQSLTNALPTVSLQRVAAAYRRHENEPDYQTYMNTLIRANKLSRGDDDMLCEALEELFADKMRKQEENGMNKVNQLNKNLLNNNRFDDLKKSIADESYQRKLLKEYGI
ncbi:MAG: hypothetical protein LIO76_10685 [Clostridiales bacterium]|nr:hypothetical protein [Clostridiales bacterium]